MATAAQQPAVPGGGSAAVSPPPDQAVAPDVSAPVQRPADAAAPSSTRTANPFAAISIGDYVRDGLALLLLLIPLGMAWDFQDNATGKVYVILVTLLSILSLSLPYLKAASVLPPHLAPAQLRLVRLAANAPYLIVVLVTLVLGYLGDTAEGQFDLGDGVGIGLVIGLAGALLAAQGRQSEQGSDGDGPIWRISALGMAGLAAIMSVIAAIIFLIDLAELFEWSQIVVLLLVLAFYVVVPLIPVLGMYRGEFAWRDVAIVIGAVGLLTSFWALNADQTMGDVWSLRLPIDTQLNGPQILFWPAIGVAAAAVGVLRVVQPVAGAARWIGLARRVIEMGGLFAVFSVIILVFQLFEQEDARGVLIAILVISLIVVAAALVGRNALITDARSGRSVAVGVAGVFFIAGIVIASVLGASDNTIIDLSSAAFISALFIFAAVIAAALTAPPSVRSELGQFTIGQAGPRERASQQGAAPAAQVSAADSRGAGGGSAQEAGAKSGSMAPAAGATTAAAGTEAAPAVAESQQPEVKESEARKPEIQEPEESFEAEEPGVSQPADKNSGADDEPATRVMPVTDIQSQGQVDPAAAEEPTQISVTDEAATRVEPEPATASGYTAAMAADPNTPLQTLADIAAKEPSLRPHIASNPATYPELLDWLGQLGDPAVDDALRRR
ncbi:hypothetical protein [Phytoactinopolyspora mesophila]|nr:hypothetical protein [Phytoactinopolyspora mesophila]